MTATCQSYVIHVGGRKYGRHETLADAIWAVLDVDPQSESATAEADGFPDAENLLVDAIRAGVPQDNLTPRGLAHSGRLSVATPGEDWDVPGVAETVGETKRMRLVVVDLAAVVRLAGQSA